MSAEARSSHSPCSSTPLDHTRHHRSPLHPSQFPASLLHDRRLKCVTLNAQTDRVNTPLREWVHRDLLTLAGAL